VRHALLAVLVLSCVAARAHASAWPDSQASASVSVTSTGHAWLHAVAETPPLRTGPWALRLATESSLVGGAPRVAAGVRVGYRDAWLGVAAPRDVPAATGPWFEAGFLRRGPAVTLAARASHRRQQVPVPPVLVWTWSAPEGSYPPLVFPTVPFWEARPARRLGVSSLETRTRWCTGVWELELEGGLAIGPRLRPIRTMAIEAVRWMRSDWGVRAGLSGGAPEWLGTVSVGAPVARIGLHLVPGRDAGPGSRATAPAWRARRAREGAFEFRLHAPGRHDAWLRGDFTDWLPVALRRQGDGFRATLAVEPGLHWVEVSFDGVTWLPPPGLSTTIGPFGAKVGIFLAE
jgi:hypothetical protein